MNKKIIALDIETTGLDKEKDEILQVSICDIEGHTFLNMYIRPTRHTEWPEAMQINGITPESLAGAPTWVDAIEHIQKIINYAEEIVTYNGDYFDIPFLEKNGIKFDHIRIKHDVMQMYSIYRGIPNQESGRYKRFKLTEAAEYFGINFNAHDSEQDAIATAAVFNILMSIKARITQSCIWGLKEGDTWNTGCGFIERNEATSVRSIEDKIIFGNWKYCPICGKRIKTE